MARMALTLLGGLIGGLLALPSGGISVGLGITLGEAIGGIAGALLFPGKGTHVFGPRVNDMQVSGSSPGTIIPILYGVMRLGGQFIWTNGLEEVATTTKQSAKGGPSVSQTTYSYFASFAVAFCQGIADITRVWGDSKLIYDSTGTGQVATDIDNVPVIYRGDETQTADPLIVSFEGANRTPAYRGTAYARWERFPLANFGNRIPNIRAECSSNAAPAYPLTRLPWDGGTAKPYYVALSPDGQTAFLYAQWSFNGSSTPTDTYIARIDLVSNTIEAFGQVDISDMPGFATADTPGGAEGTMAVAGDGFLWGWGVIAGEKSLIKIDPWTFKGVASVSTFAAGAHNPPFFLHSFTAEDGECYMIGLYDEGVHGGVRIVVCIRCSDATVRGTYKAFATSANGIPVFSQTYAVVDADGNTYILGVDPSHGDNWYIWRIGGLLTGALDVQRYVYPATSSTGLGLSMFWNPTDDTLIVLTNVGTILRIDPTDGTILETAGTAVAPLFYVSTAGSWEQQAIGSGWLETSLNGVVAAFKGHVQAGQIWAPDVSTGTKIVVYSAADFSVLATYDLTNFGALVPHTPQVPGFSYDSRANSLLFAVTFVQAPDYPTFATQYAFYRAHLNRLAVGSHTAAEIVTGICARAGLTTDDIDTSLIEDVGTLGYPITSLATGKDIISVLAQALFFEGRESDFRLQFIPRGQDPALTIPEDDLGMFDDGAKLVESIGQEQDLPKSVEVIFTDPNQDYQQNNQVRIRHSRTTSTLNQTSISLPLVMQPEDAAKLADRILWTADTERRTYKTNLWKRLYMLLDACDVVLVNYNGATLRMRATDDTLGQNYASALSLTAEDSANYLSTVPGNPQSGFTPQTISGLARTILFLLDIPYLQDSDADAAGNTGFYFGMDPASGGKWRAGVLYNSNDRSDWNQLAASDKALAYGLAQNALPAPASTCSWDEVSELTIQMVNGDAPTADTRLNVLNGRNAAILYPSLEVIQFRDVVQNMDGTYTLSGLLRGRRGTEWAVGEHTAGEMVLFPLIQGGLVHEQVSSAALAQERFYRPITVGADLNSNPVSTPFTVTGRDLMPYAPAHLQAADSGGDLLFKWVRRTRLGGRWADGTGAVPLAEDVEAYDVVIKNNSGTVARTYANVQPPSAITDNWSTPDQPHQLYSAADQSTDSFVADSGWTVTVYQLSAQAGRGFPSVLDI